MSLGRTEEDHVFAGRTVFLDIIPNSGSINNAMIASSAAISRAKLKHNHRVDYAQPNTTATAVTQAVYRCAGATGTILSVHAGSIAVAAGAATATVDVKKNGTTVLSSVITLNSSNTAYVGAAGTLSVTTLAAADVLTIVTTATAGGGTIPTGLYVSIDIEEDPQ